MHRLVFLLLPFSLFLRPQAAEACGYMPWSEDAESPQSALHQLLLGERLPLLSPSWHSEYWLIAWARLQGKHFSEAEVASLDGPWLQASGSIELAIETWTSARQQVSGAPTVQVHARRQGPHYNYELVCGADGFRVAAETLNARQQTQSAEEVRRWLWAQDRVFDACSNRNAVEPHAPLSPVSDVAENDLAYQRAVWSEYAERTEAITRYDAIALTASPWADLARYRSYRLRLASSATLAVTLQELPEAMRQTRDTKSLRGLRQLQDRYELFPQGPAEAVRVLSSRLLAEDLGADLARTLRDIVHFAKRMDDACTTEISSLVACQAPSRDHFLASLRRTRTHRATSLCCGPPEALPWATSPPMLAINAAFYRGHAALAAGRRVAARRYARRALRLAARSTRASQNAAHALLVASGASGRGHLLRANLRPEGPELHADSRGWLAGGTIREWEALARRSPELQAKVNAHILVRSAALGTWGRAMRYARRLSGGDSPLAQSLQVALAAPVAERRGRLLLAIAHHDLAELSLTQAFGAHYGPMQVAGCDLGGCMDAHPHQTAYAPSFVRSPTAERRRLGERRIDDLGEAVMAHVSRQPDSPVNEELLHRFVRLTRRASIHRQTSSHTGELSHAAFDYLHAHHEGGPWTQRTRHWFQ